MQLTETVNKLRRSGVNEGSSFKIAAGAKAFEILSSNLYSNKIKAIVRELSCNALDAHKELGKENVPFLVHLPNHLDRTFRIRDFGPGISPQDIEEVYKTYFASTKTESNDYVGCLGLGSKTPFSYTDNFSVISYYGGKKYIYFAYKNESGEPETSLISDEETTEPTGLEVQLAVRDEDFGRFSSEAVSVYQWFDRAPTIEGQNIIIDNKPNKEMEGNGWFISNQRGGPFALMGGVAYRIDVNNLQSFMDPALIELAKTLSPVLEFPIGSLVPSPNRETLSYEKRTLRALELRLKSLQETIDQEILDKLQGCKNRWDASIELEKMRKGTIGRYIQSNQTSLLVDGIPLKTRYSGTDIHATIRLDVTSFIFRKSWRNNNYTTSCSRYDHRDYNNYTFQPSENKIYILIDPGNEKKYSEGSFRSWMRSFVDKYKDTSFIVIENTESEIQENLIKILGLTEGETFLWLHDLPKKPKAPRAPGQRGGGRKKTESKLMKLDPGSLVTEQWGDYDSVDLEDGGGYYVVRKGYEAYPSVDASLTKNSFRTSKMANVIRSWNEYILDSNLDDSMLIGAVHSFTGNQLKSIGPGWKNVVDVIKFIGPFVFEEKVQRNMFFSRNSPNLDKAQTNLINAILVKIPELANLPLWKEYCDINISSSNLDNAGKFVGDWNSFVYDLGMHSKRLIVDDSKYRNEIKKVELIVENLWKAYSFFDLFKKAHDYELRYQGHYRSVNDLTGFDSVVEFVKLKENI